MIRNVLSMLYYFRQVVTLKNKGIDYCFGSEAEKVNIPSAIQKRRRDNVAIKEIKNSKIGPQRIIK